MPRVDPDSPNARYSVSVWIEDAAYFDNLDDARKFFVRQRASGEFGAGELYEWDDDGDYDELESFNRYAK